MAAIKESSITSSTISVYISGLDTSYSKDDRQIAWYIDGTLSGSDTLKSGVSKSSVWTFKGLKSNRTYTIKATIFNPTWSVNTTLEKDFDTESEGGAETPPEDLIEGWSWSVTIKSGTKVSAVPYTDWNSLIDKIDELLDTGNYGSWLKDSTEGAVLSKSASKMKSSDKVLTADRFNSVRYNIGARRGTGIKVVVSPGDTVYADYLNKLETAINNWITDYNNDQT